MSDIKIRKWCQKEDSQACSIYASSKEILKLGLKLRLVNHQLKLFLLICPAPRLLRFLKQELMQMCSGVATILVL